MSFDLVARAFLNGEDAGSDEERDLAIRDVLRPFIVSDPSDGGFWHLEAPDGGRADVYLGTGDGFMANHFSPGRAQDLIVQAAAAGDLVILGPGLPPVLTRPEQQEDLPLEIRAKLGSPVLVESGDELALVIAEDERAVRRFRERLG